MTVLRDDGLRMVECDGAWWVELPGPDEPLVFLGMAPVPVGPWRTFAYHVHRGRLEGYRWVDVLPYAWRHRHSFGPPPGSSR